VDLVGEDVEYLTDVFGGGIGGAFFGGYKKIVTMENGRRSGKKGPKMRRGNWTSE
jgi:hypothetical protein